MKSHLFFGCLVLACSCSGSNQKKYEQIIAERVKSEANDPSSYEPISFVAQRYDRLDSVTEAHRAILQDVAEASRRQLVVMPSQTIEQKQIDELEASINARQQKMALLKRDRLGDSIGERVSHFYRAKNAAGGLVKTKAEYIVYATGKIVRLDSVR